MFDAVGYKYEFTFERNASASYLVVNAGYEAAIQNYQVEMIANNPNPGILPLYVSRKNNILMFYYDITSKVSLSWLLKRKKIKKNELIGILCGIAKPLLEACNYFLLENSFVIDEEYIFVSPDLTEVSLVYVPVLAESDYLDSYKSFVLKLVTSLADIEESPADNYLQRILGGVKQGSFSIMEFDRLLKEIGCNASRDSQAAVKELNVDRKNELLLVPPEKNHRLNNRVQKNENSIKKNEVRNNRAIGLALSQIILVLMLIILFKSNIVNSLNPADTTSTYMGIALVIGAMDFLWIRSSLSKAGKSRDEENELRSVKSAGNEVKQPGVKSEKTANKGNMAPVQQPAEDVAMSESAYEKKTPVQVNDGCETVFLGNVKEAHPYLHGERDGITEKITIRKNSFIIGRLKEQVDFVSSNNAVGKLHAEILCKNGSYYIKDLNSRNGTFINDERISSNTEHEIKNNDRVSLANSDYTFVVP